MKQFILAIVVLFALVGCDQKREDQAAHDAKVAQQAREALLKELKAKEEAQKKAEEAKRLEAQKRENKLSNFGVTTTPDGKIIIDANKTRNYVEQLAKKMKAKVDRLAKDMQKGVIKEKEAGIEVSEEKIVIDVNRTKSFLEKWARKMEGFVKEMNKVAKTIEKDLNVSNVHR